METFSSIFKQTFWQGLGKVVTSASTFIILGLVARSFHEIGTGIFTLSLTYLNIFNLFADFGFNAHILKKFQTSNFKFQTEEFRKLLGTRIVWSFFLILFSLVTLPFWPFGNQNFSQAVLFGSLSILGSAVFITCNLIFQSKLRYDLSVIASSLGIATGLIFFILFSQNNFPIPYLLVAQSISWLSIAIFSLIAVKKFVSNLNPLFNFSYIKDLFFDSWPIALTLALNVVYFRLDSFLIAYFKGVSDVGIYNIAYSLFQSALVVPTFIMNAYYPLMLKSLNKVKQVSFGLIGLSILGSALSWVMAPFLINLLTGGESFMGSVESLKILSLGFPAFFLSALFMWYLVTKGEYKKMLLIYIFGLIINAVLNFIFIPKYSFIGASWVTVLSEYLILFAQAVVLSFFKK